MGMQFELLATDGWRAPRPVDVSARRGRDANLHARRHVRHRQSDDAGRTRRHGRADRARQYVSFDVAARHASDPRSRRTASFHALGKADPHGLRRVPGVQSGDHAQDHRGGRELPLAHQRRCRDADAREIHAGTEGSRRRRGHDLRRVHAVPGDGSRSAALDGAVVALGVAQPRRVRSAAKSPFPVRHRSRRHVFSAAPGVGGGPAHRLASTAMPSAAWRWASRRRSASACSMRSFRICRRIGRAI